MEKSSIEKRRSTIKVKQIASRFAYSGECHALIFNLSPAINVYMAKNRDMVDEFIKESQQMAGVEGELTEDEMSRLRTCYQKFMLEHLVKYLERRIKYDHLAKYQ